MTYNTERYREKREKVLGVRQRTISFGRLSAFIAGCILIVITAAVVPQVTKFFQNRHLDDVIYHLKKSDNWSASTARTLEQMPGVVAIVKDDRNNRLILTFNRTITDPEGIRSVLEQQKMNVVQLNVISHNQRLASLKKEAEFEAL